MKYVKSVRLTEDIKNPDKDGRSTSWDKARVFASGTIFAIFSEALRGEKPPRRLSYLAVKFGEKYANVYRIDARMILEASHVDVAIDPADWVWVASSESMIGSQYLLERLMELGAITPAMLRVVASSDHHPNQGDHLDHEHEKHDTCQLCMAELLNINQGGE